MKFRIGWCQLLRVPAIQLSMLMMPVAGTSFYWWSTSMAPFLLSPLSLRTNVPIESPRAWNGTCDDPVL